MMPPILPNHAEYNPTMRRYRLPTVGPALNDPEKSACNILCNLVDAQMRHRFDDPYRPPMPGLLRQLFQRQRVWQRESIMPAAPTGSTSRIGVPTATAYSYSCGWADNGWANLTQQFPWFASRTDAGFHVVTLPIWLPMLLVALPLAWDIRGHRRKRGSGFPVLQSEKAPE